MKLIISLNVLVAVVSAFFGNGPMALANLFIAYVASREI